MGDSAIDYTGSSISDYTNYAGDTSLDDYSSIGTAYDPTSLSSVAPNPSVTGAGGSPSQTAAQYSGLFQTIGNVGATIASVVTGNPVAVSRTGTIVGAAGSTTVAPGIVSGGSGLILLLGLSLVLFLVLREEK